MQAFAMIDNDRDGIIGSDDLAAIYNSIGNTLQCIHFVLVNKSAQSNLGRRPRRGAVAHVRRKYTPSRGSIPKPHYLPHPWTRPTYDAKRHPDPIRSFSTMHWTDRRTHARIRTHVRTDRSSTGKFDDYRPLRYDSDAA